MDEKRKKDNKNIKIGIVISYITLIVSVLIGFLFTPFCLNKLGDVEYGLRSFASSMSSYLSILSFGLSAAYIRYRLVSIKKDEQNGEAKFNSIYLLLFVIIGLISMLAGCILVLLIKNGVISTSKYTIEERSILLKLVSILVINVSLSFPLGVFTQYATAKEKFIWTKSIILLTDILNIGFSVIVLIIGYKSIALTFVSLIVSIIIGALNIIFAIVNLKMKFCFKLAKEDFSILKDMLSFSFFVGLNTIIDELNSQADPVIIGFMLGAEYVTIYNLARQFRTYLVTMSTAISSSFAPRIYEYELSGNTEKVNELFTFVSSLQLFILFLIVGGFASCGKEFTILWLGEGKIESYYLAIPIMGMSIVPLSQNISIEVQRARKKHKFRAGVYLLIAILNVFISIILCNYIGMWGCMLGTLISLIIGQYICINIYNSKIIKLPIKNYWLNFIRLLVPTLIAFCFSCLCDYLKIYVKHTVILLFIKGFVFVIIYLLTNFLFNKKLIGKIYKQLRYGEM